MKNLYRLIESSDNSAIVLLTLPKSMHDEIWGKVSGIIPELPRDAFPPHVTVMYLGSGYTDKPGIRAAFLDGMSEFKDWYVGQKYLDVVSVGWFEPSESSEWATPIVAKVDSPLLAALNGVMVRAMTPYTSQKQFLIYKPHITMGYLPKNVALTSQQKKLLKELDLDISLYNYRQSFDFELQFGGQAVERSKIKLA